MVNAPVVIERSRFESLSSPGGLVSLNRKWEIVILQMSESIRKCCISPDTSPSFFLDKYF